MEKISRISLNFGIIKIELLKKEKKISLNRIF